MRIVQFVFEGTYFTSFVVVSGHDNIYDNSAGPISTEYTLMDDSEDVTSAKDEQTKDTVANDSSATKPSNASSASSKPTIVQMTPVSSSTNSSVSTKPTTTVQTPAKQPEPKPVEINTSMKETTSMWGTDTVLMNKLS